MPTGYIAPVADGKITSIVDFAKLCARGMGALIMMRDSPTDAPIPEAFEPSTDYHDKAIEDARARIALYRGMNDKTATERARSAHAEQLEVHVKYRAGQQNRVSMYEAMKSKVMQDIEWPEGLGPFMVSQLQESIRFDGPSEHDTPISGVPMDGPAWRDAELKRAWKDLGYHENERAKEIERTAERNRWLIDFRIALKQAEEIEMDDGL